MFHQPLGRCEGKFSLFKPFFEVMDIERLPVFEDLRLNEKVAEPRVQRVSGRRCKDDLGVARDLDRSARPAAVGVGLLLVDCICWPV